jgi:hypothetical protein
MHEMKHSSETIQQHLAIHTPHAYTSRHTCMHTPHLQHIAGAAQLACRVHGLALAAHAGSGRSRHCLQRRKHSACICVHMARGMHAAWLHAIAHTRMTTSLVSLQRTMLASTKLHPSHIPRQLMGHWRPSIREQDAMPAFIATAQCTRTATTAPLQHTLVALS